MKVRIFTIPFLPGSGGFDTHPLEVFCLDKEVLELIPQFFQQENQAFWTVCIRYRLPDSKKAVRKEEHLLSEKDQLLMQRLKEWRSQKSKELGWAPYTICTQQNMLDFVRYRITTKEGFGSVKGFGAKRIKKYGDDILLIMRAFENEEI